MSNWRTKNDPTKADFGDHYQVEKKGSSNRLPRRAGQPLNDRVDGVRERDLTADTPQQYQLPAAERRIIKAAGREGRLLTPKELMVVSQQEFLNMSPKQKQNYASWVSRELKGWAGSYAPGPGDINKMLAERNWDVMTPQGVRINTTPYRNPPKNVTPTVAQADTPITYIEPTSGNAIVAPRGTVAALPFNPQTG